MRVKLLKPCAGLIGHYRRGCTVDVPKAKALRLIQSGAAAPIVGLPVERAVIREPLETRNG